MNDQLTIEKVREQGRIRQQRWYAKHAEERRAAKIADKQKMADLEAEVERLKQQVPAPAAPALPAEDPKKIVWNLEACVERLKMIPMKREGSRKTHIGGIKSFFRITEYKDLKVSLKNYPKTRKVVDEAISTKKPYGPLDVNTKRGYIAALMYCIDNFHIPLDNEIQYEYYIWHKELDVMSRQKTERNKTAPQKEVMPMGEYKDLVLKTYGKDSKEFVLISLYEQVPARDNLGSLHIVGNIRTADEDNTKNYIVIPRHPTQGTVILNEFKTDGRYKKYNQHKHKLDSKLTDMLRTYIKDNEPNGGILFKTARSKKDTVALSSFISGMNKKMGIQGLGAVNLTRKATVKGTVQNNPNMSLRDQIKFAEKTGHSYQMQQGYKTGVKN